jgi:hypothetical protein
MSNPAAVSAAEDTTAPTPDGQAPAAAGAAGAQGTREPPAHPDGQRGLDCGLCGQPAMRLASVIDRYGRPVGQAFACTHCESHRITRIRPGR